MILVVELTWVCNLYTDVIAFFLKKKDRTSLLQNEKAKYAINRKSLKVSGSNNYHGVILNMIQQKEKGIRHSQNW